MITLTSPLLILSLVETVLALPLTSCDAEDIEMPADLGNDSAEFTTIIGCAIDSGAFDLTPGVLSVMTQA